MAEICYACGMVSGKDSRRVAVAEVLLPLKLPHPFTYRIAPEQKVQEGSFVRVMLGRRQELGVVWRRRRAAAGELPARLRDIAGVLTEVPPLGAAQRALVNWMAGYYVTSPGLVLKLFMGAREAFREARAQPAWRARMTVAEAQAAGVRLTAQRARVLRVLQEAGEALPATVLMRMAQVGRSVIRGMAATGLVEAVALPARTPCWPKVDAARFAPPELNDEQRRAADVLCRAVGGGFSVHLLDGITGSGKTEVYFEAVEAALRAGRQVLLLLPEIALTGGFIRRVEQRFGFTPAQWHSDLPAAARGRIWRGVAEGAVRMVVAARSGLFLPWRDLGLIVVDEEHESAYKQDSTVPYQGRDVAVMLGKLAGVPVILASATPSLESVVNAERGRYVHLRLRRRHGGARLPEIALVDLRRERLQPRCWLSAPLVAAVEETLQRGEQALLFLNRRGYAPLTLCRACGHRLQCPHCAAWLVQHHGQGHMPGQENGGHEAVLLCHHCGHAQALPLQCPSCGAEERLAAVGPGVERLAEEAARRWPQARVLALSSDLWQGQQLKARMEEIAAGAHDIIVGTQLVAKGHHFPLLTLVGVVDADLALETVDPRAGERTWQLLAQVAGRAGRAQRPGRALVQTHMPEVPLMQALAAGDGDAFLAQEKAARQAAGMPPYGRLAAIIVSGAQEEELVAFCRQLAQQRPASRLISVLGPAPAPIVRLRGRFRYRFLVRSPRQGDVQGFLRAWLGKVKVPAGMKLEIDVDPYNFL